MIKIFFISDLHHESWSYPYYDTRNCQRDYFLELKKCLDYWSLTLPSKEDKVILILGWDLYTSFKTQAPLVYKSDSGKIENRELEFLEDIYDYILEKLNINEEITNIFIWSGNHELYSLSQTRLSNLHLQEEVNKTIQQLFTDSVISVSPWLDYQDRIKNVCKLHNLDTLIQINSDISIINSVFYSSLHWDQVLDEWALYRYIKKISIDKTQAKVFSQKFLDINDSNFLNLSWDKEYNHNDFLSILSDEKYKDLHDIILSLKDSTLTYSQSAILKFFYHFWKVLKAIKDCNTETLILNLHFPFDWEEVEKKYKVEEKDLFEMRPKAFLNEDKKNFYKVASIWFDILINIAEENKTLKHLVFLNGHTHENYKYRMNCKSKTISVVSSCLGYWK